MPRLAPGICAGRGGRTLRRDQAESNNTGLGFFWVVLGFWGFWGVRGVGVVGLGFQGFSGLGFGV